MPYQRDEHRVHLLVYHHLIWCPTRRKPVLVGLLAARAPGVDCGPVRREGGAMVALAMVARAIPPDHVPLFVRGWPSARAAAVVQEGKGLTSYHLRQAVPEVLKLPSMWTRAYFASTAGTVSQETIQRSIAAQTRR